jgi:hypothetical protein
MGVEVTFNSEADQLIRALAKLPRHSVSAKLFWAHLAKLVEGISAAPVEIGEPKFDHKHVKLRTYLVSRNNIAIQFAVSEDPQFVFIEKISLSGKHLYPGEFEGILHPKKP